MTALTDALNSTRGELLRQRKWPAAWVTLGAWLLMALMFGYLFSYLSYKTGDASFISRGTTSEDLLARVLPANVPNVLVQGMPMFGGALMMVLGAIIAGNGYGWGTWKTLFTQGPSRISSAVGSMVAMTVFVAGVVLATLVAYLAVSLAIALTESQPVVWPALSDVLLSVGGGILILEMWALFGFALGTIARSPALAVGLGLVWALVFENLLRGVGAILGPVEAFTAILPGTASGSMVGALVDMSGNANGTPGVLDVISGTQATITVMLYLVALPLLSLVLIRRRDVA